MRPRLVLTLLLTTAGLGCGKKEDADTQTGPDVSVAKPTDTQGTGKTVATRPAPAPTKAAALTDHEQVVKDRLGPLLPEGYAWWLVDATPSPGSTADFRENFFYGVVWSRPGYVRNKVRFLVAKHGDRVEVDADHDFAEGNEVARKQIRLGKWEYRAGKLVKETALEATAEQWDWLRKRAGEVAQATHKAFN